ncbi:hypothetical protein [Oryzicola mucosus]|uniref:Uncharacterized protein n=1 Tax=Oryzicola mucosus TaxID=2767425 RepID=A0A8J6U5F3_9HYPH|nr:hypothetical protein [Oryzicola mucosus]MBD0416125.1 hypothetical protein [Oryzicola mucosus]
MKLLLDVKGATEEQLAAGMAAAVEVFKAADMHPLTAAEGFSALEAWDDAGFPEEGEEHALSDEDSAAADVWLAATKAALLACSVDGSEPEGTLELLTPEDDEPDL